MDANDNIYVVWHDYRAWADDNAFTSPIDVYMDVSTDGGATWGTDVLVSTGGSGSYPWHFQGRSNRGLLLSQSRLVRNR